MASGSLMRPREMAREDAIFVVYDEISGTPTRELAVTDLHDASHATVAVPPDAPGWFVRLDDHGTGEKGCGSDRHL